MSGFIVTCKLPGPGYRALQACCLCRFVRFLPDMEFVVNDMDEPRILPGVEDDIDARFASLQCANASEDFLKFRHLHGSINSRSADLYTPCSHPSPYSFASGQHSADAQPSIGCHCQAAKGERPNVRYAQQPPVLQRLVAVDHCLMSL